MALNLARYKAKHKEASEKSGGGRSVRLKSGKNYIRIFKFQHKVTERDYILKLYHRGAEGSPDIGDVVEEISRPYFGHFLKGQAPQMCHLKTANCEYCQEAKELRASSAEGDARAGRQLARSERNAVNIVVMDDIASGMQRLDLSKQPWAGILAQYISKAEDGAKDEEIFGCNGRDFIIEYDKNAEVNKIYTVTVRDKERSQPLPAKLEDAVVDLFRLHELDPVDAPPVENSLAVDRSSITTPIEKGDRKPANPSAPKEEKPEDSKLKGLEDSKPELVGKIVAFMDEDKEIKALVESQNGTVLKVRSDDGAIWEVDVTELVSYPLK